MAMCNKFITFLVLMFIVSYSYAQQYTPMTAAGYQYKRAKVDSTLHIPSFCGVPNLRNSTAIQGALAMDTCGNKLYQWTHAAGWSTISTNAIDSLKRSNDSIFARKSGVWVFQYKDSVGGGAIPSLQDVATVGNIYNNDYAVIELNKQINGTSGNYPYYFYGNEGIENRISYIGFENDDVKLKIEQTGQFGKGININSKSINLYNNDLTSSIDLDTSGLKIVKLLNGQTTKLAFHTNTPYATDYVAYMPVGSNYSTDTLSTLKNIRENRIDTANKWVNSITRTSGKDSIIYYIGSTRYAIKDSVGGSSQNGRFGNDTATIVMAKVHNNSGSTLTNGKVVFLATSGTNSDAPSVRLANNKADSTSANTFGFVSGSIANNDTGWVILSGKIEKLNTSAYSNGDIIYLDSVSGNWTKTKPVAPYHMVYLGVVVKSNAGNGSIFVKCQNGYELDEIHDVQIISKQNNQILIYSDTQKIWKNRSIYSIVDTTNLIATKTNVAAKVNISDTATMLTPYLRSNTASATYLAKSDSTTYYTKYRSDTSRTNIYNAIGTKLNISDTANKFVSNISRTIGKDSIIFNIGSTRYAIKDSVGGGSTGIEYQITTGIQNFGSTIKGVHLGIPNFHPGTSNNIANGTLYLSAYYLPTAQTITGAKWYQATKGNYTANNENRIGLYTSNAGTLTLVASCANDGTLWQTATNQTWGSKSFSSTYSASSGTYYIGFIYSSSSQATAPALSQDFGVPGNFYNLDLTNNNKIIGTLSSQTTLPSTITLSSVTTTTGPYGIWLY